MADHTFDDRLAERKRKREEEKAFQEAIKQKANNPSSGLDIDLGGSTVSTTVTQTQNGVTTTVSTGSGSTVNLAPPGSVGYNSYSDELKEESRRFQALEKKLISEATVLEGAVYHHYNDDGSFAGISQGEPLKSTLAERIAARNALRVNPKGDSEKSETTQFIKDKSPIPSFLNPERKKVFTQLIKDNPEGYAVSYTHLTLPTSDLV